MSKIVLHPKEALSVKYQPLGHPRGARYYVWKAADIWFWESLGGSGMSRSFDEACQEARNWIKHGMSSMQRPQ